MVGQTSKSDRLGLNKCNGFFSETNLMEGSLQCPTCKSEFDVTNGIVSFFVEEEEFENAGKRDIKEDKSEDEEMEEIASSQNAIETE